MRVVEVNFFKFAFELTRWRNRPELAAPAVFEINFSLSQANFKLASRVQIDLFSVNQLVARGKARELFERLTTHLETLLALYQLDQSFRCLDSVGQHSVTGESYFLFHQITPLCWELQFLPYAPFFREFPFFLENFVSIRFRLDELSAALFLFQELKTGELMLDFYDICKERFAGHVDYAELILRVVGLDCARLLRLVEALVSFTMVRTNLKLCKSYVG